MAANRKFLIASTVFILLLITHPRNSLAYVYEWKDFTKPFNQQLIVTTLITVEVDLPDFIVNNLSEIPLVFEHSGVGVYLSSGRTSGILTINEQDQSKGYRFGDKMGNYEKPVRLLIKTKDLKTGMNKLHFRGTSSYTWGRFRIYKIYFDLPDIEKIRTVSSESPSPSEIDQKKAKSLPPIVQKDITSPQIIITSHDTSRGIRPVQNQKRVTISGRATDANGIVEITVNSKDVIFDEAGNFEVEVYLKMGDNHIVVAAMDVFENRVIKEFTIKRVAVKTAAAATTAQPAAGQYYALVIGNNNYQYLRKLKTAQKDARQVAQTLKAGYGFDSQLLLDADREDILDALNGLRRKLQRADLLLIYYAGHGEFDETANKAYWLPVDAQRDNDKNWIIVDTITSNIKRISSKHVLIVADSCYSGTFTRRSTTALASGEKRSFYLDKMLDRKSRTLLASGGNEPVSDTGGQGHSVFAKAFLFGLNNIAQKRFTAEELYITYIKEMVAGSSEQTPEYNIIRNSGHEGGDFVFKRKN